MFCCISKRSQRHHSEMPSLEAFERLRAGSRAEIARVLMDGEFAAQEPVDANGYLHALTFKRDGSAAIRIGGYASRTRIRIESHAIPLRLVDRVNQTPVIPIRVVESRRSGRHYHCGGCRRGGTLLVTDKGKMTTVRSCLGSRGGRPSVVLRAEGFGFSRGIQQPLIVAIHVAYGWFARGCLHCRPAVRGTRGESSRPQ